MCPCNINQRINERVIPTVDKHGIYMISTTGKISYTTENGERMLDYGLNPCEWNSLPSQGVLLLKVRHPATVNEAQHTVSVVIPNRHSSTVNSNNVSSNTNRVPVLDNKGSQTVGEDVTIPYTPATGPGSPVASFTEHIVYFNKCDGIFRLLGVKSVNSPAATTATETA